LVVGIDNLKCPGGNESAEDDVPLAQDIGSSAENSPAVDALLIQANRAAVGVEGANRSGKQSSSGELQRAGVGLDDAGRMILKINLKNAGAGSGAFDEQAFILKQ